MIKAGSLFYAIVISLIIAIVSSSLILFSYLTHIQFETFEINQRLQLNADSGLNLLLSKQSLVGLNETKSMDLYADGIDSVELTRKSWGAFEIAISKAIFKNTSFMRVAQIGYCQDTLKMYSIYLSDEDKPLAVCGKTLLKGVAYLPKAGVKRAYIEGQNFVGNDLISGTTKQSERSLTEFDKSLLESIQNVFTNKQLAATDSVIQIESDLSEDTLQNSFLNKTIVLASESRLKISSGFYSGNVAIISSQQITISSEVVLQNILLFAPKIIIEERFSGCAQLYASDSVIVKKNVTFTYPSVIGLLKGAQSPVVSAIVLNENDSLSGCMFAYKKAEDVLKQSGIIMSEKCFVYGQIYSNGFVDAKGAIYGSLMCNKLLLKTHSSIYENHLLNVVIDRTKLSNYFVGINLVEESTIKRVVKWEH